MFSIRAFILAAVGIFSAVAVAFAADTNATVATAAVYVPDMTHAEEPLPDGVFAWDSLMKSVDAGAEQPKAEFLFSFTNTTSANIAIVSVHPSCGCTTAHLPTLPWIIPPGGTGQLPISVNLAGKTGTIFKSVTVSTEKGRKELMLRINMQPPVIVSLTDAQRAAGVTMAKADRQAIFNGDCASCHAKNVTGKYGRDLYDSVCGICHEAPNRATMVPDLHHLTVPTNDDFWRTWITYGKPGSLMAAFSTAQGGPLDDMQIASLAAFLNATIPSHVAPPQ